jgi:DNA-directed RNA polymerase III subunit RPC11
MWFCPFDGTLLHVQNVTGSADDESASVFVCRTCPYVHKLEQPFVKTTRPQRKEVDDILGGSAAWENVDRTRAVCSKCSHHEAYFMQMQIRSADEPMSVFYKCCKCGFQWNDK